MKKALLLMAAALLLVSAAPADVPISFEIDSWGHPLTRWRIDPDGSIIYSHSDSTSGPVPPQPMHTRATAPSPARYRWIANLLGPASKFAGHDLPCKITMTDQAYGEIRWGGGPPLAFNGGFTCPAWVRAEVMQALITANEQVGTWVGKDGKPVPPSS